MELEILKFIAPLGTGGIVAAVIFFMYRKDTLAMSSAWQGQSAMLVQVVREVTIAMTALIVKHDALKENAATVTNILVKLESIAETMKRPERRG